MKKINIHGSCFGNTGYDHHTRNLANALYQIADMKLMTPLPENWVRLVNDAEMQMITKPERKEDYNLIITVPHMWKLFIGVGKNIGYCVWEGNRIPESWIDDMLNPNIHYIFVPSKHTADAIENTINNYEFDNDLDSDKILDKIKLIPHGVDHSIFNNQQENYNKSVEIKGLPITKEGVSTTESGDGKSPAEAFKFICNKGWRGTTWDRGGVQYLLKAFTEEFTKEDKTELILKLNPSYINPEQIKPAIETLNLPKDRCPIHINCNVLPPKQLNELYNSADCYVCATRAEAFNLPGLEAMSCGLPTIQTNFGGQIDYMSDKNSLFVEYEAFPSEEKPMYEEVEWAIPNIESLKKQMRWAYNNKDKIKEMGIQAQKDSQDYSWESSAKKIIEVLK